MKKNNGFSVPVVIIIILIIAILGVIAWRVFAITHSQSPQNTTGANENAKPADQNAVPGNYLSIKELGIKIKLDANTADITYIHDKPADSKADGAWIIDTKMKAIDNANQYCAGPDAGKIGRIDKSSDPNYWGERPIEVDGKTVFQVNGAYVVFRPLQSDCSQDNAIARQRAIKVESFKAVLPSLQAE